MTQFHKNGQFLGFDSIKTVKFLEWPRPSTGLGGRLAKQKVPKSFLEAYPETEVSFVTRSNYWEMLDATEV